MRPLGLLPAAFLGVWLAGCSKPKVPVLRPQAAPDGSTEATPGAFSVTSPPTLASAPPAPSAVARAGAPVVLLNLPAAPPELTPQEKYEAAFLEALNRVAEHQYAEALAALEAARAVQDSEPVRHEIDRVKRLLEQHRAATRAAESIQTVIDSGKPEEAAHLAMAGLEQFGPTDEADRLAQLLREADALAAAGAPADKAARLTSFREQGQAALADNNLRAAASALEQALQYGDDPALRRQWADVQATLARYDDNRRRAALLVRDPTQLEEAVAALQEAARAWDTVQVRQEIDTYTLLLQKRRDRVAVADFEVRGEVGIPLAGRALAEALLPAFRPRFDVIERGQLTRVQEELRLEAAELAENPGGCREVGRLAGVRYLVLGSVTRLGGLTVHARLVEVRSGLVVQTAKVVAATPEELLAQMPRLANVLMMSDEQKLAYEAQLAQQASTVVAPVVLDVLPPPPAPPDLTQPLPPPLIAWYTRPPDSGGLRPQDFDLLAPAPPPGQPALAAQGVLEREEPVKQRLLRVAVELGDNLFRRGCYREAQRSFELALNLSPGHFDLQVRLDRCRALLPPAGAVVAPVRPRIAVFGFLVNADPALAPPGLGDWVADQVASDFAPAYDVVERGEVFWYMARLGLTMRDAACDPAARRWLARALDVRFLVFGVVEQTASLNITTHLVDAETGSRHGSGRIHVQDRQELKLRVGELVRQVQSDPSQRSRLEHDAQESERGLHEALRFLQQGQPARAVPLCQTVLRAQPTNVALETLLDQAEQQVRQAALAEARRRQEEQRQAEWLALQQRQQQLAREAELARRRAEQAALVQGQAARRTQERQRQQAYARLLSQARRAVGRKNYAQAVGFLESAVALKPTEAGVQELARVRAAAEQAAQARVAAEQARHEAELRRRREAEVAQSQARLAEERRRCQAEDQARHKAQEARDQTAATKLLGDAQQLLTQGKYDAAVAALQTAQRLHPTDEVDRVFRQGLEKQAAAGRQDAQARAELERRRAEEQAAQQRAEAEASREREQYRQALEGAQQALAARQYDLALARYQEAGRFFQTDAVLDGLRLAQEARALEQAAAGAAGQKQAAEQRRADLVQRLLRQGQAALDAKQFDQAAQALTEVNRLVPGNGEAARGLLRTEQAKQAAATEARRGSEEQRRRVALEQAQKMKQAEAKRAADPSRTTKKTSQPRTAARPGDSKPPAMPPPPLPAAQAAHARLLRKAATYERQQRYDEALAAYQEALRLVPGDPRATTGLHLLLGQKALRAKRFPDAAREFEAVLKITPNQPDAQRGLQQARQGRP